MIFPHSTASNRRADSGVTEATCRLLPALALPVRPAKHERCSPTTAPRPSALRGTPSLPRVTRIGCIPTSLFDGTAHTPQAGWRRFQALSLGSHQMARLTRRSGRFTTQPTGRGRGVLLNADLGSLCLPIHIGIAHMDMDDGGACSVAVVGGVGDLCGGVGEAGMLVARRHRAGHRDGYHVLAHIEVVPEKRAGC